MTGGGRAICARVIDQGNGVYRIDTVGRCDRSEAGVLLGVCDFATDVIECALARLGLAGDSSNWVAYMQLESAAMTLTAWLP